MKQESFVDVEIGAIRVVKIVPDNTSTIKGMKAMLMKQLNIDPEKFDLVIASLGKGKIY